jgi:hypothetical protein
VNQLRDNIDKIYLTCNIKYDLKDLLHYMQFVMELDIESFRFQLFSIPDKQMVEILS